MTNHNNNHETKQHEEEKEKKRGKTNAVFFSIAYVWEMCDAFAACRYFDDYFQFNIQ